MAEIIYLADRKEQEPAYGSKDWIVRLHAYFEAPYVDWENDLIWFGVEGEEPTKDEPEPNS